MFQLKVFRIQYGLILNKFILNLLRELVGNGKERSCGWRYAMGRVGEETGEGLTDCFCFYFEEEEEA